MTCRSLCSDLHIWKDWMNEWIWRPNKAKEPGRDGAIYYCYTIIIDQVPATTILQCHTTSSSSSKSNNERTTYSDTHYKHARIGKFIRKNVEKQNDAPLCSKSNNFFAQPLLQRRTEGILVRWPPTSPKKLHLLTTESAINYFAVDP